MVAGEFEAFGCVKELVRWRRFCRTASGNACEITQCALLSPSIYIHTKCNLKTKKKKS